MKLLLRLVNKTQEIIDADDVICVNPAIIADEYNNGPPNYITIIEVLTTTEIINCTSIDFAYGEAYVGRSLSQTRKIAEEKES